MPVVLQPGVLVRTDEATVVYLVHHNSQRPGADKFVVQQLSPTLLFVKRKSLKLVRAIIASRLRDTVFEEEDDEDEEAS